MPNYLNTFSGGMTAPQQQGVNSLFPQQQGQANQPKLGQPASQLGRAVGMKPPGNAYGLSMAQPNANAQGFYNNPMRTPPTMAPTPAPTTTPIFNTAPVAQQPIGATATSPTTTPAPTIAPTLTTVPSNGSGLTSLISGEVTSPTTRAVPSYSDPNYQNWLDQQKTSVLGFGSVTGMAGGGIAGNRNGRPVVGSAQKDAMVRGAIAAVQGSHPNPRMALRQFEGVMGRDATNDLIRAYGTGGQIRGAGGGVDDLVPGSIDGREDVRLASGEYVIPARVVSALGDGDTERGSQILDDFVARVRAAASEAMMGSEPIDAQALLPEV